MNPPASGQPPPSLKERLGRASVLVVGDAMLDRYWFGAVDRISPEAPVPVVRVNPSRQQDRLGGAANVAWNVQAVGARASLLTAIGDDAHGQLLQKKIQDSGIECVFKLDPTFTTIVKLRVIGRSQQLLRVDFEEEPDHEVLEDMFASYEAALPQGNVVLFSDYGKGGLTHIPRMIELARAQGKPVLVDPKGSDYERYRGASIITPNRAELAQVVGGWSSERQLEEKARTLRLALGLEALLVTRSEEGMSLFDARGHYRLGAQAREVFDVTGAGDTVIGVLAAMLAAGVDLRAAVDVANRAGGIVVGKFGTATASYEELFP